jgi:hypothetical protein
VRLLHLATVSNEAGKPQRDAAAAEGSISQVPTWLWGEWSRDWIQRGKVRSNTLDIHYLQTPTYFADMRIPRDRPAMASAKSFADLSDEQLLMLTRQNGFTGQLVVEGSVATWHHDIDFLPPDGTQDRGRLVRIPPTQMLEYALDGSYIESWRSTTCGEGKFVVIRVERCGRLLRTLVVAGNQFLYVRNRAQDLPAASSFESLLNATKAARAQVFEYLDCEFSTGRAQGDSKSWVIEQSTLPWREGHRLDFIEQLSVLKAGGKLAPVKVGAVQWTVPVNTLSVREVNALFHSA